MSADRLTGRQTWLLPSASTQEVMPVKAPFAGRDHRPGVAANSRSITEEGRNALHIWCCANLIRTEPTIRVGCKSRGLHPPALTVVTASRPQNLRGSD
jgi:hypothetical protein